MSQYINPKLAAMEAYIPGEQPQDKRYIKLNTNESPYPPSKGVKKAVGETIEKLRLYSNPDATALKMALAELYGKKKEQIFISNGSDEALNFAFWAFGADGILFPDITYGFYEVFANLHGMPYEQVPLKEDFSIDPEDYCGKRKMVVIANPNAPTGLTLSVAQIEKILQANPDHVVLVDEAYVDFGGNESCMDLVEKYPNLLCVYTFSKSRSMAGARIGYAVGNPQLIADLEKIKYSTNPFNVSAMAQAAGLAALQENDYYMGNCRRIIRSREYTKKQLEKLGFTVLPAKTNFLFAKTEKLGGKELYLKLRDKGILVRHFAKPRTEDYIRITIGSQKQMQTFVATIKEILGV